MSQYNILLKVSGSIACYKACELISLLVKNNFNVKVALSDNATKFVGSTTFEALSGHPVFIDDFQKNKVMSHISLNQWADLIIVYPATANTINQFASGIAQNLIGSCFLAHDFKKLYLIAPAMNPKMWENPITQQSLLKLSKLNLTIIEPQSGRTACGDMGIGRLAEPSDVFNQIVSHIQKSISINKNKKILITAGGSEEPIDAVRSIINFSTGTTGLFIANYFAKRGYEVDLVANLKTPLVINKNNINLFKFKTFLDLKAQLEYLLNKNSYELIIHSAAVNDFRVKKITTQNDDEIYLTSTSQKISSANSSLSINLVKNEKLISLISNKAKKAIICAFKLTNALKKAEQIQKINTLIDTSNPHFVIHNDLNKINKDDHPFDIYKNNDKSASIIDQGNSKLDMAQKLQKLLERNIQ